MAPPLLNAVAHLVMTRQKGARLLSLLHSMTNTAILRPLETGALRIQGKDLRPSERMAVSSLTGST